MKIKTVRTNFSQFFSGIVVSCSDSNTKIVAEVSQDELADFALMLMDVADDCFRKLGDNYSAAQELNGKAMEAASNPKPTEDTSHD